MAENIDLNLNIKGGKKAVNTIGDLEKQLEKAREEIKKVEVGSEAFEKLASEIQKASSEVKTLEKQMEGLEPQQKAEAFLRMGEGIAGGFVAIQGAMGLLGIESENIERIQVKVQSAIAIAMGVRMMAEAALMAKTAKRVIVEKAATIATKLNTAATKAAIIVQKAIAASIGVTIKSLKGLKAAIVSTGIGALVVGVSSLVSSLTSASSAAEDLTVSATNAREQAEEATRKFMTEKTWSQDRQRAMDDADKIQDAVIRARTKDLIHQRFAADAQSRDVEKARQWLIEDIEANDKRQHDQRLFTQGRVKKSKRLFEEMHEEYMESRGKALDLEREIAEEIKEKAEEERRIGSQRTKDAADTLRLTNELRILEIEDEADKRREQLKIQQETELAKINTVRKTTEEIENFKILEQQINDKYAILNRELEEDINDEWWDDFIAKNDAWNEAQLEEQDMIKETARVDREALEMRKAARDEFFMHTSAAIGHLGSLFEQGSKAQKAASLIEISANFGVGLMQAFRIAQEAALQSTPFAFPIFYASQTAALLAALKNAKDVIGMDGETASISAGGIDGTPSSLQPNVGAFTLTGDLTEQEPLRAYVVTDEMSESQDMLANIRRRATI